MRVRVPSSLVTFSSLIHAWGLCLAAPQIPSRSCMFDAASCTKVFPEHSALAAHVQTAHTALPDDKACICAHCGLVCLAV
jgi:hypothetical protein